MNPETLLLIYGAMNTPGINFGYTGASLLPEVVAAVLI